MYVMAIKIPLFLATSTPIPDSRNTKIATILKTVEKKPTTLNFRLFGWLFSLTENGAGEYAKYPAKHGGDRSYLPK